MGVFLVMSVSYGTRYSFGIFVKPMSLEYGWSRSVISLAASINMIVYSICGIAVGRMLDRVAPRWIITLGAIITSLGYILTCFSRTPLQFCLVYGLLCGAGTASMGSVVGISSVGKWFIKKRGIAIGLSAMGGSFGTIVLTITAGFIEKHYNWQTGFLFLGIVIFIIGTSLSQLLLRRTRPEDYGLLPDGEDRCSGFLTNQGPDTDHLQKFDLGAMFRDGRFWVMAICYSLVAVTLMSVLVHQVACALDKQIEKVAAAASMGVVAISGFCGQFFYGWLSDRVKDVKYPACLGMIIMAVGMVLLLKVTTVKGLYIYAFIYGFGYGSFAPMIPILVADRFGRHVLGSVYGIVIFFAGIGGGIGPLLGGVIFDRFGSYTYLWQVNIGILVGCALLIMTLKPYHRATAKG
jgi:MFS family permease